VTKAPTRRREGPKWLPPKKLPKAIDPHQNETRTFSLQKSRAFGHTVPHQVILSLFFLCLRRMSSPPVGLVQWLSDITSNPPPRQRHAMSWKGFAINGGASSRQLRRGIEPRLHKLRQKNKKRLKHRGKLRSRPIKDTERQETTRRKRTNAQKTTSE